MMELIRKAVFAAIDAAYLVADAYGLDRAGIEVCAQKAIAAYLEATSRPTEAKEVSDVVT